MEETVSRLTCISVRRGYPSDVEDGEDGEDDAEGAASLMGMSSLLASSALSIALLML